MIAKNIRKEHYVRSFVVTEDSRILSTARIKSVNSIMISTRNRGHFFFTPKPTWKVLFC